ncbi:MAG: acetyl-CoA acetyltransferase [Dehalococcoidia bacterium]
MEQGRLPIIVGVSQYTNRSPDPADVLEPLDMMIKVAKGAEEDAGCRGLLGWLDSVGVVNIISWSYADAPGLLAEAVGAQPTDKVYTTASGSMSQWLVNRAAERIVRGDSRLALVAGAEALRSRVRLREYVRGRWRPRGQPEAMVGDTRPGNSEIEMRHNANVPVRIYPLFENAIRAHKGRSLGEHQERLGRLCARLSQVAKDNPFAWFRDGKTAEEITTITADNRLICFPYPKYMNAIIEVDQAAAVIMTSVGTAQELGIPRDRWVYIWGWADATDLWYFTERVNYYSSPALARVGKRTLEMAGLDIDDIDWFDLYSCFPSAVEMARDMLGIAEDDPRPITVTGGLPYFGGPGSNYSLHAVCAMAERLRREPQRKALVSAMGWYVTKHAQGIYSGMPPEREWRQADSAEDQAELDAMLHPPLVEAPEGEGVVETYTVVFDRAGEPEFGIVVGRLEDGGRFIANTQPDRELLRWMTQEEMVGRRTKVSHNTEAGRNIATIE